MAIRAMGIFGLLMVLILAMEPAQAKSVEFLGPPVKDPNSLGRQNYHTDPFLGPPVREKSYRDKTYKREYLRPLRGKYYNRSKGYGGERYLGPPVKAPNNFSGDKGYNGDPAFLGPPVQEKPNNFGGQVNNKSTTIQLDKSADRPVYDNVQGPGTVYGN